MVSPLSSFCISQRRTRFRPTLARHRVKVAPLQLPATRAAPCEIRRSRLQRTLWQSDGASHRGSCTTGSQGLGRPSQASRWTVSFVELNSSRGAHSAHTDRTVCKRGTLTAGYVTDDGRASAPGPLPLTGHGLIDGQPCAGPLSVASRRL